MILNAMEIKPRPFIKWAGSKTKIVKKLYKYVPKQFENYYEPFLGSGAFFFYLIYKRGNSFKAYLSDLNEELINTFIVVRDHVDRLIALLKEHQKEYSRNPRKYYYYVRDKLNPKDNVERAARMIFLNKTCYNGLYRVNQKGKFNVPFGRYEKPKICDEETLKIASWALKVSKAEIHVLDYRVALKKAKKGDFIYLDPPYQPLNSTSNFTDYTQEGFSEEDQKKLAEVFNELTRRGCKVVLSNSDTPLIHTLYSKYDIEKVRVARTINCKGEKRTGYTELIINNLKWV